MRSATAVSHELDNIEAAASELAGQIREKLAFGRNSVAILHGQPDTETGRLSAALKRELGCHVIGGTAAGAAVLTSGGHHELAVALHVLTGDDCLFSPAISGSLADSPREEIRGAWEKAYRGMKEQDSGAEPKMVLCIAPTVQGISPDQILAELSEASGSLPIFGYIAADDFEFGKQKVFCDGESAGDRMAILILSGNINPVFQVAALAGKNTREKIQVTCSRGNIIREIDGRPAYEYIKKIPSFDDKTKVLWNYQFFVEMESPADNDSVPVPRVLDTYDKDSGEVSCFAEVPQGSTINLMYCEGDDVAASSEAALKEFAEKIKAADGAEGKDGSRYSTLLVASCSLRNMFLAGNKEIEGNLIKKLIPANLAVSGLYGFGEMAPARFRGGRAVNRIHNATIAMCAI